MVTWVGKDKPTTLSNKCKNDKRYYWSAGDFSQEDINTYTAKERSELFEYGVETQCKQDNICGNPRVTNCYICVLLSSDCDIRPSV